MGNIFLIVLENKAQQFMCNVSLGDNSCELPSPIFKQKRKII